MAALRSLARASHPSAWLSVALGLLLAAPAGALPLNVTVTGVDEDGTVRTQSGEFQSSDPDGDGIFSYDLANLPSNVASTGVWSFGDWSGSYDPDPSISHGFNVTNLLPGPQTFTIIVSAVTGPIGAPTTVTGGSAQGGVTDTDGDGATLSTVGAGTAFYTSLLDGTDFVPLYADPSSVSVGSFLSGNLSPTEDFGTPIPELPGAGGRDLDRDPLRVRALGLRPGHRQRRVRRRARARARDGAAARLRPRGPRRHAPPQPPDGLD